MEILIVSLFVIAVSGSIMLAMAIVLRREMVQKEIAEKEAISRKFFEQQFDEAMRRLIEERARLVRQAKKTIYWYDVLGVPKEATMDEIKRAYRAKALQAHPDRGGSHEKMARINRAMDIAKKVKANEIR